jgi:hypothetical protein
MVLGDVNKSSFKGIWDIAKELETEARECFNDPLLDIHNFIMISLLMGSTAEQVREVTKSYSAGLYFEGDDKDYGKEEIAAFLSRDLAIYISNMEDPSE